MAFGEKIGPSREFKTFGEALKYWREERRWTLDTAAERFDINPTYLSRIERGPHAKYKPPEIFPTAFKWADHLGLGNKPDDHAQFIELALRDRHGPNALQEFSDDEDFLYWWEMLSSLSGPPPSWDPSDAYRIRGGASVHECIGRVAEAALNEGSGDLGFRAAGGDGSWDIWRIQKPKSSRKRESKQRRAKPLRA